MRNITAQELVILAVYYEKIDKHISNEYKREYDKIQDEMNRD